MRIKGFRGAAGMGHGSIDVNSPYFYIFFLAVAPCLYPTNSHPSHH